MRDTCYVDLTVPELENPPVENGNEKDECPGGQVDEDSCRGPDGLTQLHSTRGRRKGIKVFQVVPEKFGPGWVIGTNSVSERKEI